MEKTDYQNAYDNAISLGKSNIAAGYFAKIFSHWASSYREDFDADPEYFAIDNNNKTVEDLAYVFAFEKLQLFEDAKSWGHSDEWALFYADDNEETKDGAYEHIRIISPEAIYNEAYNEYIARGFSEKYAALMAKEIRDRDWGKPINEMESIFLDYERLYNDAISKGKSEDFAEYYTDYCCPDIRESSGWAISLFREKLQFENKSDDYIKDAIRYLTSKYDDFHEKMLMINDEDHWMIIQTLGYADGVEYAKLNNISNADKFGDILADHYCNCKDYDHILPYKELALYATIKDYNHIGPEKLHIEQSQIDVVERFKNES
jgi:hypothetical protein